LRALREHGRQRLSLIGILVLRCWASAVVEASGLGSNEDWIAQDLMSGPAHFEPVEVS
jgi:hypothetical protein